MSTNATQWSCSNCGARLRKPRRLHEAYGGEVQYKCVRSGLHGKYKAYREHRLHCAHCSPDLADAILERAEADKENRVQAVEDKEEGHLQHTPPPHATVPLHPYHKFTRALSTVFALCRVPHTTMG